MEKLFNIEKFAGKFMESFLSQAPKIVLIILISWLAVRAARMAVDRMERAMSREDDKTKAEAAKKRARTLAATTASALRIAILAVAGTMILDELGIKIAPLLASVGFLGLAFGFGAQSLVKDLVTGFFVLVENQYAVGESVTINGITGRVEDVSLRVTTVRDITGAMYYIPNGQVAVVCNKSRDWSRAVLDVEVAYRENPEKVISVIRETCGELKSDEKYGRFISGSFEIPGIEKMDGKTQAIRVMVKTLPQKQEAVTRELRKRLKAGFEQANIETAA